MPYEVAWDRAYLVVPFLSWIPNLLVAEWYLATRYRGARDRLRRPSAERSVPTAAPNARTISIPRRS